MNARDGENRREPGGTGRCLARLPVDGESNKVEGQLRVAVFRDRSPDEELELQATVDEDMSTAAEEAQTPEGAEEDERDQEDSPPKVSVKRQKTQKDFHLPDLRSTRNS
ncbi:unnamed protein product [Merluccius merluccius]